MRFLPLALSLLLVLPSRPASAEPGPDERVESAPATPDLAPPSPGLQRAAWLFGAGRIVLGGATMVALEPSMKLLGFPAEHDNPSARLMARLFGVRDIGLGVLVIAAADDRRALRRAVLFNAAMDVGDALMAAIPLLRRDGIDRGAGMTLGFALGGLACWTLEYLWLASDDT